MKDNLKAFLFSKHILVGRKADHPIPVLYTLLNKLNIKVTAGYELACDDLVKYAAQQLGEYIPEPFYRGFPQTVRELTPEARLLDQLVHYTKTYGFGRFEEVGHSVFEDAIKRSEFSEEEPPKEFRILSETDAVEELKGFCDSLCMSTRPLNLEMLAMLVETYNEYGWIPVNVASKSTAVALLYHTKNMGLVKFIDITDVIKLVDYINWTVYGKTRLNKLNLKNQDRKLITKVLDTIFDTQRIRYEQGQTCCEKRDTWKGLLHHIHYAPKNAQAEAYIPALCNGTLNSAYSMFEELMSRGDVVGAAEHLKQRKGNGALLRNLNYIVRNTGAHETKLVMDMIDAKNPMIIMQMQNMYRHYNRELRTFRFIKHERVHTHREEKRGACLTVPRVDQMVAILEMKLKESLAGRVGKVYIAPGMENIAVPMNMSASESGFGIMPTGSKIKLPEGKKIRAFTYWEKVNDIDLACFGIDEDGERTEFSWRTMWGRQSDAVTYSGDETSGYHGGSEYFDIDLDKVRELYPDMKYMVFTNNVYSGKDFSEVVCRAGWMSRDVLDSGEVYEPKTVRSAYTIDAKTTFAYLFAIDIADRSVIWLNVADANRHAVAGESEFSWLYDYFTLTDVMNMRKLFEYAGTVVDNIEDAELVVGDVDTDKPLIRPYEFEKTLAYLQ